jgi:hypothetical protein
MTIAPAALALLRARVLDDGLSSTGRGNALTDYLSLLLADVPGVKVSYRNALDHQGAEEIDVGFHNAQRPRGLLWLDRFVLVECKNWSTAVTSAEVAWFRTKLEDRGLRDGLLVARTGITGSPVDLTAARNIVSNSLASNRRLLIVTWADIEPLMSGQSFVRLIESKVAELIVMRANF